MSDKAYRLTPEVTKPLISSRLGCLATDRITVDGLPVGYMHREEPLNDEDSGWRLFAGDESELYLKLPQNYGFHPLNTLANYDPAIVPYLECPAPCAFARIDQTDEFEEIDADLPDDA